VKSAARALSVLGAVEQSPQGKGLAELSTELGLNKTTVLRILRTLVAERVLQRDACTGLYAPNASSWLYLAPFIHPALTFLSAVQARLDELAEAVQATAALVLPCAERRHAVLWMHSEPKTPLYFETSAFIGSHAVPLHAAVSGRCYLASLPPDVLATYIEKERLRTGDHAVPSLESLGEELTRVRKQGYALGEHEAFGTLQSLAVSVREPLGEVLGALCLFFVEGGGDGRHATSMLPMLRDAATDISEALSYNWWTENIACSETAVLSLASPWDAAAPGFGDGPTPYVRTVTRMVRLMATLFAHPRGLSLSELSRNRKLDKATAWRLLSTLAAQDVVWRSMPDRRYHISPLFWIRRAGLIRSATLLTSATRTILQASASASGGIASLEFPDLAYRKTVVHQFAVPSGPLHFHPENRQPLPLHLTATGKCCLAAQSRRVLNDYLGQMLTPAADGSSMSREQLLQEVAAVRKRGYALSRNEMARGLDTLAVPVSNPGDVTTGSVAIAPLTTGPAAAPIQKWLALLRWTAGRLSRMLAAGWPG
jgi:IclR family acetate operon transcriptional repressor